MCWRGSCQLLKSLQECVGEDHATAQKPFTLYWRGPCRQLKSFKHVNNIWTECEWNTCGSSCLTLNPYLSHMIHNKFMFFIRMCFMSLLHLSSYLLFFSPGKSYMFHYGDHGKQQRDLAIDIAGRTIHYVLHHSLVGSANTILNGRTRSSSPLFWRREITQYYLSVCSCVYQLQEMLSK